jgi:hypothetical protein
MKHFALALLLQAMIGPGMAGSLFWDVVTDPELVRVSGQDEEALEFKALRRLYKSLDGLDEDGIRRVFGEPTVIEGKKISFPKGYTVPAMTRSVFGDSIANPKVTTHLYTLHDQFVVAYVYWGEGGDIKGRTRSVEFGFRWDDPFKKPYRKLTKAQLGVWEMIRASEFLRDLLAAGVRIDGEVGEGEDPDPFRGE